MSSPTDTDAIPRCAVCRSRDAAGILYDPWLQTQGYPYCLDCFDAWWEREVAVTANPKLAAILPPLPDPTWNEDMQAARRRRRV